MSALVTEPEGVMRAVLKARLSLQEYLGWDNARPEKDEVQRGEVFAMTGRHGAHGRVLLNLDRHIGAPKLGIEAAEAP